MSYKREQAKKELERRLKLRRLEERRIYGRELTDAERDYVENRVEDRREILDRRRVEIVQARGM